jgi:hypothetical protein
VYRQLYVSDSRQVRREHCDASFAVTGEYLFVYSIEAEIVCVGAEVDLVRGL